MPFPSRHDAEAPIARPEQGVRADVTSQAENILKIRLIGHMVATTATGENILPAGARRTRGLLAILALSNRKPVMRQRLTELLWSRRPTDLARASLRQEIHRLLDALQPFGNEIIDIGRHTLTLKPDLTSVDVEEIYSRGLDALDEAIEPEEMLFIDLNGIDPAFDLWLQTQRARLSRHIQGLMTPARTNLEDPTGIFLPPAPVTPGRLSPDNDGDTGLHGTRVPNGAANPFRAFSPGSSPWKEPDSALEAFRRPPPSPATEVPPSAPHADGEQPPHAPVQKVRALTLAMMPIETKDPSFTALADEFGSQLNVLFVGSDVFTLVVPRHSHGGTENLADWIESLVERKQIDFLCTGVLHPGDDGMRLPPILQLRLIDMQHGGEMIWTVRTALPPNIRQHPGVAMPLLARAVLSAQWTAVLRNARSLLKRSVQTLTPDQLAARALSTLLQANHQALHDAETLLKLAEWLGPTQPLVALARAVTEITRAGAFLQDDYTTGVARALAAAQHAAVLSQNNLSRNFLLAFVYSHIPGHADTAEALLSAFKIADEQHDQAWFAPYRALQALLALMNGQLETARELMRHYRVSGNAQPLSIATDPGAALYLFLLDLPQEASKCGRMVAALYPQLPSALVYHLVALTGEETGTARTNILARLTALDPTLTIRRVMAAHAHLPLWAREKLEKALGRTGLPE
ncbi:hypothetical protein AA12717_4109 [Gluconacetobacter sacchari DSM 12717]|uniref:DNA-binding transcriptional activator of the SARP family n=1 Tax=Gluconacetobacter sacchari DSM 12717 TaxID=1307940 RepID=A0ABQ0PDG7_9PROT|nr:hypothetical protein AA12717_4109 [Gluconacetobacter sacchari DSM 12717]